jgi:hypothetical protein
MASNAIRNLFLVEWVPHLRRSDAFAWFRSQPLRVGLTYDAPTALSEEEGCVRKVTHPSADRLMTRRARAQTGLGLSHESLKSGMVAQRVQVGVVFCPAFVPVGVDHGLI